MSPDPRDLARRTAATARHELSPAEVVIAAIVETAGTFEVDGTWTTRAAETAIASSAGRTSVVAPALRTRLTVVEPA